ncbi:MAG: hypothetical protein N4A46_04875 [Schleiferiaceae bacterium]|nr:hypothetical protein [Schleiferiaceae bacterium]
MRIVKNIIVLSILLTFLGCENHEGIQQFPIITTLDISNLSHEGVNFNAEVVYLGTSQTTEYGFVWCEEGASPTINDYKVVLGTTVSLGNFSARIEEHLSEAWSYNVRAYAIYKNRIVYSNGINFNPSPFSKLDEKLGIGSSFYKALGASNNNTGYVIMGDGKSYGFNSVHQEFHGINWHNYGRLSQGAQHGDDLYFLDVFPSTQHLLKLSNNEWSVASYPPFNFTDSEYQHVFSHSQFMFVVGRSASYGYDLINDQWAMKNNLIHTSPAKAGVNLGQFAYIITEDKNVYRYNSEVDSWNLETTYPGELKDKTVSFSHGDKIYFGLSHNAPNTVDWITNEIWSYDTKTKVWKEELPFRADLTPGDLFWFKIEDIVYLGNKSSGYYIMYSIDVPKL